jgi:tetratricopeptide (TPR) repeat protein
VGQGTALDFPDRPKMNGSAGVTIQLLCHRNFVSAALILLLVVTCVAQDADSRQSLQQGVELLRETRYAEAERLFLRLVELDANNADARYYLALSRSQQGRLNEAITGFEQVLRIDPKNADACFEIAGIYVRTKDYSAALSWIRRGLQLSPQNEYGLEIAGTVNFLLDSKIEALRYWNRLNRPHLSELRINSTDSIHRQRIAEEIHLVPGDLLSTQEIDAARWRLRQHRYIRGIKFQPTPGAEPDQYALDIDADMRRGVGSRMEFLFNTLSNIGFQTWRLTWWDIAGRGVTSDLLWRWRSDAQRIQLNFDMPRPVHLPVYAGASYNWRDESWYLSGNPDQTQSDFRLRTHEAGVRFLLPVKVPQLSLAASVVTRARRFDLHGVPHVDGSNGVSASGATGTGGEEEGPAPLETARRASWFQLAPVLQLREKESPSVAGLESRIHAGLDIGRAWDPISRKLSRFSVSWENRIDWNSRDKLQQTLLLGLHGGYLSEPGLAEDHFMLGVGPDTDFWLRAHPYLREGKPGNTPLAGEFLLGNLTVASDVKNWKWIKIGALAFLDVAQVPRLYPGQPIPRVLADVGIGVELGSPIIPSRRFTIMWGHDTRTGHNVFYLASALR